VGGHNRKLFMYEMTQKEKEREKVKVKVGVTDTPCVLLQFILLLAKFILAPCILFAFLFFSFSLALSFFLCFLVLASSSSPLEFARKTISQTNTHASTRRETYLTVANKKEKQRSKDKQLHLS